MLSCSSVSVIFFSDLTADFISSLNFLRDSSFILSFVLLRLSQFLFSLGIAITLFTSICESPKSIIDLSSDAIPAVFCLFIALTDFRSIYQFFPTAPEIKILCISSGLVYSQPSLNPVSSVPGNTISPGAIVPILIPVVTALVGNLTFSETYFAALPATLLPNIGLEEDWITPNTSDASVIVLEYSDLSLASSNFEITFVNSSTSSTFNFWDNFTKSSNFFASSTLRAVCPIFLALVATLLIDLVLFIPPAPFTKAFTPPKPITDKTVNPTFKACVPQLSTLPSFISFAKSAARLIPAPTTPTPGINDKPVPTIDATSRAFSVADWSFQVPVISLILVAGVSCWDLFFCFKALIYSSTELTLIPFWAFNTPPNLLKLISGCNLE